MPERQGFHPPDEPVIGAPPPARRPAPPPGSIIGAPLEPPYAEDGWGDEAGDAYDAEYEDEYDDGGYYGDGYDESPARQPIFYVFIGLAAAIGAVFIYLLFSMVSGGDGEGETKVVKGPTKFEVTIDQPVANERIDTGKEFTVAARATASEKLTRFDLYVKDRQVGQVAASPPSPEGVYSAAFRWQFSAKGENEIFVRVTAESGAFKDSAKVKVVAIEGVGERPITVKGRVIATVNVRRGPGETFEQIATLSAGQEVKIIGKTRDSEWLLIEFEAAQRWVKRDAIDVQESLALVPPRDPTPVPQPTATPVPSPSPSPSASPSPSPSATTNPAAPDLAPTNAMLIDGGTKLRVTVQNLSSNSYNGPVVVAVANVVAGTLTKAFAAQLPANGTQTVDFDLDPPVTAQKSAQVKVDPDNAIKETNEDNNTATFGLAPPVEQPNIVITKVDPQASAINVTISNSGGALPPSPVSVKVTVGANAAEQTKQLALAKGQGDTFTVTKPGTGAGKVEVLISGTVVASQNITVP